MSPPLHLNHEGRRGAQRGVGLDVLSLLLVVPLPLPAVREVREGPPHVLALVDRLRVDDAVQVDVLGCGGGSGQYGEVRGLRESSVEAPLTPTR